MGHSEGPSDFVLVPLAEMTLPANWEDLSRTARLDYFREQYAELDRCIRARIPDLSVEYLSGASSWNVRSASPIAPDLLRHRLSGLPVRVADEDRYFALE